MPGVRRRTLWYILVLAACAAVACDRKTPPPSILVVVFDSLRADAVSAYGGVSNTTPHIDALASEGLRYVNAFAPAPWTIPSHVSLFTGWNPEHHRVGWGERAIAGPELVMLAERVHAAGYDTAAFVENPLVSASFGMDQGFEHFRAQTRDDSLAEGSDAVASGFEVTRAVDDWLKSRKHERPFFVFVNLSEARQPYRVRNDNPFVPPGTSAAEAAGVLQSEDRICDALPPPQELAILRGLYLGDVAAADATFGQIHRRLSGAAGNQPLVTVVTADHGAQFGERRLLDHRYSIHSSVLRIPLVVGGVPHVSAAVVATPLTLTDVAASILYWAGVDVTGEVDGSLLPMSPPPDNNPRTLLSLYKAIEGKEDWPLNDLPAQGTERDVRAACGLQDCVFGDMASVIRYPYKLNWYERCDPQLYNLAHDPGEQRDLASQQSETVAWLIGELDSRINRGDSFARTPTTVTPPGSERVR